MLKELCEYIELNTSFVIGTTLQTGHRVPTAPDECIVVLETGGNANFYLPGSKDWSVQILTRAKTYFTARANAYIIHDLLQSKAGIYPPAIDNAYCFQVMQSKDMPAPIGQDKNNLFEFSQNFSIQLRDN